MTTVARITAGVVLGAAWGALSSFTNAATSPSGSVASLIANAGFAWAGVAVAAGALVGHRRRAAVAGVLVLIAMTTAYYGLDSVLRSEPFGWYWPEMRVWWLLSLPLGSVLGAVGASIERTGVIGLLAALTVPVGAVVEMFWLPRWPAGPTAPAALDDVRVIVLVVAVATVGAVIAGHGRRRTTVTPANP